MQDENFYTWNFLQHVVAWHPAHNSDERVARAERGRWGNTFYFINIKLSDFYHIITYSKSSYLHKKNHKWHFYVQYTHLWTRTSAVTWTSCDSPEEGIMAAGNGKKRGLEHLDEYEPKPAKHLRSLHDRMAERRLVVILEGASLETVKVRR